MNILSCVRIGACALALSAGAAHSQVTVGSPLRPAGPGIVPGTTVLTVDQAALDQLRPLDQAVITDFPLPNGATLTLELSRVDVFTPDAKIVVNSGAAQDHIAPPTTTIYSGTVSGDPASLAFISISDFGVNGYIELGAAKYVISSGPWNAGLPTLIFDPATLPDGAIRMREFTCAADSLARPPHAPAASGGMTTRAGPCREAIIAVESDYEYTHVLFQDNVNAATAYVATLFSAISEIYKREVNTTIKVNFVRTFTTDTDPYTGTSSYNKLFQMQDYWNVNMKDVQRSAVHMLTATYGDTGGVAYVEALCWPDYDYGLSDYLGGYFPYPLQDNNAQNWDLVVVAHELGHNFGAPHTHDMTPLIDGCGLGDCSQAAAGTIMSYCHTCGPGMSNIALNLHPRMINERILPYLDTQAPCNITISAPSISTQPLGASIHVNQQLTLIGAATGTAPFTYQWLRNNNPIPGATSPTYSVEFAQAADSGSYQLNVTNACTTVTSDPAQVSVTYCFSDFNKDGFSNALDYDLFVAAFLSADATSDVNGDGFMDAIDYDVFIAAWVAGC